MISVNNDSMLPLTRTVAGLRQQVSAWRKQGQKVALIPTMGALHRGHLSLVELGNRLADKTVASIFINPTQFAAHEDLGSYPRQEEDDLAKLAQVGCDFVYAPNSEEMYKPDYATSVKVDQLSTSLCGASRPHFFGGVATIVAKLLNQCQPDMAVFGEKDYQQLLIIRRLAIDLDIPVEIVGGPLVREPDGLAMSSRNQYLSAEERRIAGKLNVVMKEAIAAMISGAEVSAALEEARKELVNAGFASIDYLEVRNCNDLDLLGPSSLSAAQISNARLFAASLLGRTRLIDNIPLEEAGDSTSV